IWWVGAAVTIAIIGTIVVGALSYTSPVVEYTWSPNAQLASGPYALIGSTGSSLYVISCPDTSRGVVEIPSSQVIRAVYAPTPVGQREPSVLEMIAAARSLPDQ